jgi:ribosomal protein L14E/L6E/L27E
MEKFEVGMLAKALAGHDFGKLYVIIGVDEGYVYLADGKIRTMEKPKKKRKKHVQLIKETQQVVVDKIRNNEKIQNEEIKRIIKLKLLQGGNADV